LRFSLPFFPQSQEGRIAFAGEHYGNLEIDVNTKSAFCPRSKVEVAARVGEGNARAQKFRRKIRNAESAQGFRGLGSGSASRRLMSGFELRKRRLAVREIRMVGA